MAKVDPSDASGVYIPAYLNRRTQVVSWDKPPASEQVPENEAQGNAAPALSPELEAAEAAASAAEAAAAADKAEGHRLLMAQAAKIEERLETGGAEVAAMSAEVAALRDTLGRMEERMAKMEAAAAESRRDLALIRQQLEG